MGKKFRLSGGRAVRVVVLGGMGFLGRSLVKRLVESNKHAITVFDRAFPKSDDDRLSEVNYVQGSFESGYDFASLVKGADLVIHLVSTSVPGNEKDALAEIRDNVIPSVELFEACIKEHVGRIVFMSSGGTVYGASGKHKNCETDLPDPINTYGLQKVMIEQALRLITHNTGTNYQIVRLSNPYGPGQNPLGTLGLITKLVYQALNHDTIHIFGDGSVVRDFIYVDDAIQGVLDVIERGSTDTTYNIGRGVGTSILEVVDAIKHTLPETLDIQHTPARPVDVPYSVLDISKYRSISTLDYFVSLEDGILRTYEYFKENR